MTRSTPFRTVSFQGPDSTLSIIVRPTKALTPGDVLREVDSLSILSPSDYLVVQAGYVGNVDLKSKVEEFGERRKADQSLTMSCLVSPIQNKYVSNFYRSPLSLKKRIADIYSLSLHRTNSVFAVHALSPNHQLFHYEQSQLFPKMKSFKLPREALSNPEQEVTTRSDLESVGLVICSNEVIHALFLYHLSILDTLADRTFRDRTGRTTVHGEFRLPNLLPRFRQRSLDL